MQQYAPMIRGFKSDEEVEDCAKLYENGWTLTDIAKSKDIPINDLINELRGYISIDPADIAVANQAAGLEDRAEYFKRRRPK